MSPAQRQLLFDNTARALGDAPEPIKRRHVANCTKADPAYGAFVERLRAMALQNDPQLRSTLLKVGFSGGDTGILILTAATLLTRPLEGFLAASAYCVVILATTVTASNRLLHAQPMTASSH